LEKKTENFPKFSQNENLVVKIGKLFANFDKNILIFEKNEENPLSFSHDFLTIFVIVHLMNLASCLEISKSKPRIA